MARAVANALAELQVRRSACLGLLAAGWSSESLRVYPDPGKGTGPVFSSVEKAQDYLRRR